MQFWNYKRTRKYSALSSNSVCLAKQKPVKSTIKVNHGKLNNMECGFDLNRHVRRTSFRFHFKFACVFSLYFCVFMICYLCYSSNKLQSSSLLLDVYLVLQLYKATIPAFKVIKKNLEKNTMNQEFGVQTDK